MLEFIHYIYSFYGLAFFLFGFTILHYPTDNSIFRFTHNLHYLGIFGILYGSYEWLVLLSMLEDGESVKEALRTAGSLTLILSYSSLLFFALSVIWDRMRAIKILSGVLLLWIVSMSALNDFSFYQSDIFSRYILGLPGIFLSAYIFFRHHYVVEGAAYEKIKFHIHTLGIVFFVYGLLAGVIVPKSSFFPSSLINETWFYDLTGVPVQLFRAICAILASHSIVRILQTFRHETDLHLLKLSSALQESGDSVMITDPKGQIEYVNRAFEHQSGFTAEEAIGKNPNILRSGENPPSFYEEMWQTICAGKNYHGIIINRRKDTTLYHEFKTIVPLKNQDGGIINYISTGKDITARMIFEKELTKAASTDPLTGAANRLQCDRWLQSAIQQSRMSNTSVSLILFDIDHFKKVNDTYGHNVGDNVLVGIAKIVHSIVRNSDMFARWGGEEFVILQTDTTMEGTITLAERLRREIERFTFDDVVTVTISLGVTMYDAEESIESFIKKADDALYRAKREGRNRISINARNIYTLL